MKYSLTRKYIKKLRAISINIIIFVFYKLYLIIKESKSYIISVVKHEIQNHIHITI